MAIIEKNYTIPNLTAGYVYNLTSGQTYSDPFSEIVAESESNTGHIICGTIDLDIGTFDVTATLMTDQYHWNNGNYELVRSDVERNGNRFNFKHSLNYEYFGTFSGRFDTVSFNALKTNCVAFQWEDVYLALPSTDKGDIYLVQSGGESCKGYRELWHLDNNDELQISGLPESIDELGAFANAENLVEISIPPSVKKIGRYSFANTSLTSVRIARDCTYYPTTFPQNCTIHFY